MPHLIKYCIAFFCFLVLGNLHAQDTVLPEKPTLVLTVSYNNTNNIFPFVAVNAKAKIDGRFQPVGGINLKLYLNDATDEANLMGNYVSNEQGNIKAVLPATVSTAWNQTDRHSFIAIAEANKNYEAAQETIEITKAKITIDTLFEEETHRVKVSVFTLEKGAWLPLPDAELKLGVARLGGSLPVNDTESFTTDSTGVALIDFSRISLPGDARGNLTLVASIEDNEMIGNVSARINVPWGIVPVNYTMVLKRSLWGTSDQTPLWLLATIFTIIGLVWGTLFYLAFLFIKIRKLGKVEVLQQHTKPTEKIASIAN